ncbi:MAG: protein kinase [Acidobacteriota bacterium]|nr:protein kinase [Acidobacteriota bacterium]
MQECPVCGACYDSPLTVCPSDEAPLEETFSGPRVIDGKYRIEQRLGYGGMGVVYRARHLILQRPFALKLIRQRVAGNDRFLTHFRREAEALGQLEHPHIVDVSDFGVDARDGGIAYLVMEYLDGITLDDRCGDGALAGREALPLLDDVARAVDFAHARGFLHRDLKPSNVFLARAAGETSQVKVLDFGLSRRESDVIARRETPIPRPSSPMPADDDVTAPLDDLIAYAHTTVLPAQTPEGGVVGTMGYIAPELLAGKRSGRSADLYAFGVLVYRVLTGRLPYDAFGVEYLDRQMRSDASPPSAHGLDPELDAPMLALLSRNPDARPATATGAMHAIRDALARAEMRRWRAREVPRRAIAASILGIICALLTFPLLRVSTFDALEGKTTDVRFALMPERAPDPHIAVVLFDEATTRADRLTISERADEFGRVINRAFERGVRSVAIDLLLPPRWGESRPFAELLLRHSDAITLAAQSTADGVVIGTEPLSGLITAALGAEKTAAMFGFAELDVDADGVTREGRLSFRDARQRTWPSFAAHAAARVARVPAIDRTTFPMDWRTDPRHYRTISWKDFEPLLETNSEAFRSTLLIVGGAFTGSGDEMHRSPRGRIAGPLLQAASIDTIVEGLPLRRTPPWLAACVIALAAAAIAFVMLTRRRMALALFVAIAIAVAIVAVAAMLARFALLLVPVAVPLALVAAALAGSAALRAIMANFPSDGASAK